MGPVQLTDKHRSNTMTLMKKSRRHFHIVLRSEPEGGFTVLVPALPRCVTYGRTLTEDKSMAKDALSAYIGSLKKHNESNHDQAILSSPQLDPLPRQL